MEIGAVSKRGGGKRSRGVVGGTAGIRGHRKLRACVCTTMPTGSKFSTGWESISQRERGGLGKRRSGDKLKYCSLSYWIWRPDFSFSFFSLSSVSASWEIQSSEAAKNQTKNLWLKKRDCYGFYFRIHFFQVRHKKKKLHNLGAFYIYRNEWEC